MREATEALLKVKKEHPEARGDKLKTLVGCAVNEIRIKNLIQLGWSFEDISKELKIAESVVRRIAAKAWEFQKSYRADFKCSIFFSLFYLIV